MEAFLDSLTPENIGNWVWGFLQTNVVGMVAMALLVVIGAWAKKRVGNVAAWFTRGTVRGIVNLGQEISALMDTSPEEWSNDGDGWRHRRAGADPKTGDTFRLTIVPGKFSTSVVMQSPPNLHLKGREQREVLEAIKRLAVSKARSDKNPPMLYADTETRLALIEAALAQGRVISNPAPFTAPSQPNNAGMHQKKT